MSPAEASQRIAELRAELARHDELYYRQAKPEITDFEYDSRKRELAGLEAENGANRERFRQYLVTLAAEREQRLEVMDREAQRCRGILARQPNAAPKTEKK